MLTQAEIDEMRDDFAESLPDQALLVRTPDVDDGQGGYTQGEPDTVYDGACRLSPIPAWRSSESAAGGRILSSTGWFITLSALVTVYEKDIIEVRFPETLEVRVFEIAGAMDSRTYQIGTRLLATEVT